MTVTNNVAQYLKDKGINLSVLAKNTGIPYPVLYASVGSKTQVDRELRADELLNICVFLNLNPMDFIDLDNLPKGEKT